VLAVSVFVLVGFASIVSDDPGPTPADTAAHDFVAEIQAPWLTDVAKIVTGLGSGEVTLVLALVAAIVLAAKRHWPELGVLVGAVAITHIGVPVLKDVVDRPRPLGGLVDASGSAYPSGHAAYSVIYAWLALTVALRLRPGWAGGTALVVVGVSITVAAGLSRVYLDVHRLSDVSGGWALGVSAFALCAIVALVVTHLRQNPPREETSARAADT
jgi:undecaprenyl-diphosphatase